MRFFFLAILLPAVALAQTSQPAETPPRIFLWHHAPGLVAGPDVDTDPTVPTMDVYLPESPTGVGIVILPGGGYTHLSTVREGSDVAKMLNGHGIAAFVVRYRHAPRYHYPIPMQDAARAIRMVRTNADQFDIKPNRIGLMGFSAGGHLAATIATGNDGGPPDTGAAQPGPIDLASPRPDFVILLYPVITFTGDNLVHKGSRTALVGDRTDLWPELSADQHVTSKTPPVFLVHATTDTTVPVENSIMFYLACRKAGVPVELHIFAKGRHGFGLAPTDPALRVWPDLMVSWMKRNSWLPQ